MDNIQQLKQWIDGSDRIVFFGGAGVSTESGIPDFRSVDGLYNQKYDYPPETILSHSFFMSAPGGVLPIPPGQARCRRGQAQPRPPASGGAGA